MKILNGDGTNAPALKNTGNPAELRKSTEMLSLYIIIRFIPIESSICHAT